MQPASSTQLLNQTFSIYSTAARNFADVHRPRLIDRGLVAALLALLTMFSLSLGVLAITAGECGAPGAVHCRRAWYSKKVHTGPPLTERFSGVEAAISRVHGPCGTALAAPGSA